MPRGSQWERDVCKDLSKWIQGTEKPYIFWRGRGSGATFTRNDVVGETFAGDIYHIREEGKFLVDRFVIECKSGYPKSSLDNHLKYNKKDYIKDFWVQVCNDSIKIQKLPMLIYKKKGFSTPWVGINPFCYNQLQHFLQNFRFVHIRYDDDLDDIYFFEMKEFFDNINNNIIKNLTLENLNV